MGVAMSIEIRARKGLIASKLLQQDPGLSAAEAARQAGTKGGYARALRQRQVKAAASRDGDK